MSMKSSDFGPKEYNDGRTKQAFKDSTDVNRLLDKHAKAGTLSALAKTQGQYGDFADFDFHEAQNALARGKAIFDELPREVKREFNQSPADFFAFVNDPENADRLPELLPELAAPGRQLPVIDPRIANQTPSGVASEPQASETTTTEGTPAPSDSTPPTEA